VVTVAEEEIEKLKKLSPKERIGKLKKLQEKNKEEIEKAQKLLKQAEEEADIEEEMMDIPIPQLKAVDIDELFTPEERELFKAKRFITGKPKKEEAAAAEEKAELEKIAETAPRLAREEEQQNIQYLQQLSQKPVDELFNRAKEIYNQFKENGYLSPDKQNEFTNIEYANRRKLEDIEAGKYTEIGQQVAREMVLIEKMKHALQYRR